MKGLISGILLISIVTLPIMAGACKTKPVATTSVIPTTSAHDVIVYDAPIILVNYDEIINTYHLRTDNPCTIQDVEEIFNLLRNIQNDPKFIKYPVNDPWHTGRIFGLYGMSIYKVNNDFIVGMSDVESRRGGYGTLYSFIRRSDGRYELLNISNYIE